MKTPEHSDRGVNWMLAYQRGDESAFDKIVEAYSGQLFALFTRFLGPLPEREDLVQETFLRVIRSRDRYEPSARFSTYLYRIAFNLSVNRTERGDGIEAQSLDVGDEDSRRARELPDVMSLEPSVALESGDVVQAVRSAIAALPETQRIAMILAKYEEMPYEQIAEVMGSTEKAIKSLVHRARENLRTRLAPYLQEERL